MVSVIDEFRGDYSFLSNFYLSPIYDGTYTYPTVEHYFQLYKTTDEKLRGDYLYYRYTPNQIKRIGRSLLLRSDWEVIKDEIMYQGVYLKFSQNEELRDKLLSTGITKLIEGNIWHDNYWGSCTCARCQNKGRNKLGEILTAVRNDLTFSIKEI